jgi:hypothetical protein
MAEVELGCPRQPTGGIVEVAGQKVIPSGA